MQIILSVNGESFKCLQKFFNRNLTFHVHMNSTSERSSSWQVKNIQQQSTDFFFRSQPHYANWSASAPRHVLTLLNGTAVPR